MPWSARRSRCERDQPPAQRGGRDGARRDLLREARHLRQADLPYGAASRAYYAVFHAARALLFSLGLEPTSHRGVVNLLGEHFVNAGRLSPELARLVSRMHADRHDADYFVQAVFTSAEAAQALEDAERFLAAARGLLADP